MSCSRTTVSAVVVLLLFTCDLTWAKTGGGGGGYYGGYGSYGDSSDYSDYSDYSKGGKGGPKSCKSNDKYSDIPCHEFDGIPTVQPVASPDMPSPTTESGPSTPSSPSAPSIPSIPTPTQPTSNEPMPTDGSPPSEQFLPTDGPPPSEPSLPTPSEPSEPSAPTEPSTPSEPTPSAPSQPETNPSPPTPTLPSEPTSPLPTPPSQSNPSAAPSPAWVASSACKTDNGTYGSQTGSTSFATFGYEIETRGTTGINLESDVLPALEVSFNDFLLAGLFPACSLRRLLQQRRKLAVVGLSADPPDVVDNDASCETPPDVGNECSVVDGVITLISDGDLFLVNQEIVRDTLKDGMENDAFLYIHPDIVRVSYREANEGGTPVATDTPDEGVDTVDDGAAGVDREVESGDDDNNAVLIGTVSAAAAVVILLSAFFARRRRRRDGDESSSLISGEPYGNFPPSPPPTT